VFLEWTLRIRSIPPGQRFLYAQLVLAFLTENTCAVLVELDIENAWLYRIYLPIEFLLLLFFAMRSFGGSRAVVLALIVYIGYLGIFWWESHSGTTDGILNSKSLLFAWSTLAVVYTILLVRLAERAEQPLWKEQIFWAYLSIVVFMGGALPYIGMLNRLYRADREASDSLFVIIDVLFFARYAMAWKAGRMLAQRSASK
jgi:magnesium-transporting ATPase (P-type)